MKRIDIEKREDLLPAIMKQPGLFYRPLDREENPFTLQEYVGCLRSIEVFEITGGVDFHAACQECLRILRGNAQGKIQTVRNDT